MSQISICCYDKADLSIYRHAAKSLSPFVLVVKEPNLSFWQKVTVALSSAEGQRASLNCWGLARRWGAEGGNG